MFFETPGVTQATVAQVPFEFTLVEMTPPSRTTRWWGGGRPGWMRC
jgi:hypothetical protein